MVTRHRIRALLLSASAAAAAVALSFAGAVPAASAHDELLSTDPADAAVVAEAPAEITLTFSDIVMASNGQANQVRITDSSCNVVSDGSPVIQDNVVTQKLSPDVTGPVHVVWRVVSRDGHPVSGDFAFTVGDSAASPVDCDAASSPAGSSDEGGSAEASAVLPWVIGGVVFVVVVGGVVVLLITRSRRPDHR